MKEPPDERELAVIHVADDDNFLVLGARRLSILSRMTNACLVRHERIYRSGGTGTQHVRSARSPEICDGGLGVNGLMRRADDGVDGGRPSWSPLLCCPACGKAGT